MAKHLAWSWSRLNQFEECPWEFYHNAIAKDVTITPEQEAIFAEGRAQHSCLELMVQNNCDGFNDPRTAHMESFIRSFRVAYPDVQAERKLTLREDLSETSWRDWDGAWVRSALDMTGINGERAAIVDWKTGRPWPDGGQLALNSVVLMTVHPQVQVVDTSYIYIHHNKAETKQYTRDQVPVIWDDFRRRVEPMQIAHENQEWIQKPGRHCGRCSLTKAQCKYK